MRGKATGTSLETATKALAGNGNGGARERVAGIQRARMLAAMLQEISERGAANVSVARVVSRSGVSRRTFYEIFSDREDCFLAAFDEALNSVRAVVVPAYEQSGSWRVRIRAGLVALLEFLECDPVTGRLLIVESLAAGPAALQRRQGVLAQIVPLIERGHEESKLDQDLTPLTAEGIVGGVLAVLHARVVEGNGVGMPELTGALMGMIVLPYLGPNAARQELARPAPERSKKRTAFRVDPLQDLPMRFTYRTMRVLMSVAAHPGSSNRTIGETSGIGDQGQASKLLGRLHRLGLIENEGGDPARGEPNAWKLTSTGEEVYATIASLEPSSARSGQ